MPSGTSKEERKRKRASEAQEVSAQSQKKAKREAKSNGVVRHDMPTAPETQVKIRSHLGQSQAAPEQEKQKSKKSKKSKKPETDAAVAGASREQEEGALANTANQGSSVATEEEGTAQAQAEDDSLDPETLKTRKKQEKLERKQQKQLEKSQKLEHQSGEGGQVGKELPDEFSEVIKEHGLDNSDALVKLPAAQKDGSGDLWRMSLPSGGRYIDHDPVFTEDEKYIILATTSSIHVYEAENSLLIRTIKAFGATCYALSSLKANILYVGTKYGTIHTLDWSAATKLSTINAGKGVRIKSLSVLQSGLEAEDVFSIETSIKNEEAEDAKSSKTPGAVQVEISSQVVLRKASSDRLEEEPQVLLQFDGRLQHLRVLDQGRIIIVAGFKELIVGSTNDLERKHCWAHLKAVHAISCVDVFARNVLTENSSRNRQDKTYSVTIGNAKGEVLVYDNILDQLDKQEGEKSNRAPHARALRWHREAPNTVKWSKDGNYIISGGNETVLCLWQLETGRRQDLPHLTAAIRDLTVSPTGTSYAVHLADNSIIVLSTTELLPKTHIAGPQSLCIVNDSAKPAPGLWKPLQHVYTSTPMLNHSLEPSNLLLAVPVNQQVKKGSKVVSPTPFLQTYNIEAGRHMSRQALTRNFATEASIDPDNNKITVPNVSLMQVSHDGQWLATVEDWLPPARDVQYLATDKNQVEVERRKRRETHLKIWHWEAESKSWALNTRVARPHADSRHEEINQTFHLAAHPTRAGFATIGEDNSIRLWRPRKRGEQRAWHAKKVVKLGQSAVTAQESSDFLLLASSTIGRLAYSNDGSVLAVCQQDSSNSKSAVVSFLYADTGEVRAAETGLSVGYVVAMGFLERYLIVVSHELRVWDTVTSTMVFSRPIGHNGLTLAQRIATQHLAISEKSGTFAVAGLNLDPGQPGTSVLVFQPDDAEAVFWYKLHNGAVAALTPLVDGSGYVVLDSQAEIRKLTTHVLPVSGNQLKTVHQAKREELPAITLGETNADKEDATAGADRPSRNLALEDDRQMVRSEQLAKVFAAGSGGFGLPNVKEMFDGVASLFAVKAK